MQHEIKKYPVQHFLLKKYIKFFWELKIDQAQINHRIIPQRNINMRFNLNGNTQYLNLGERKQVLENVFFSGLQDHFLNAHIITDGNVHILGACFMPDGFYPFMRIHLSEFKNRLLGADEVGFRSANSLIHQLNEIPEPALRISLLEKELLLKLTKDDPVPDKFRQMFAALQNIENASGLSNFCLRNNIDIRQLERLYNKYVGVSAKAFLTLNRFHKSLNQLLYADYEKFSDLAFDNDYFDQMHFIKEFKRFTGNTPKNFIRQNNSILQIGKLT